MGEKYKQEDLIMANVVVNAVGDQCPIPVVKATKALKAMTEAGTVEVHVDNEIAVQNLTRLASSKGLKSFAEKKEEKLFIVKITLDKPLEENGAEEEASCGVDRKKHRSSHRFRAHGTWKRRAGQGPMKGFIFALSQLDELPSTILFYNGGATITTEGSPSLDDLKNIGSPGRGDPYMRNMSGLL